MRVFKRLATGALVDALEHPLATTVGDIVALYSTAPDTVLPLVAPDEFCPRHAVPPGGADYIVLAPEGWYWAKDNWGRNAEEGFHLTRLSEPVPSLSGDALYQMPSCCARAQELEREAARVREEVRKRERAIQTELARLVSPARRTPRPEPALPLCEFCWKDHPATILCADTRRRRPSPAVFVPPARRRVDDTIHPTNR